MYSQVIVDKKEYDSLVEFKKKIQSGYSRILYFSSKHIQFLSNDESIIKAESINRKLEFENDKLRIEMADICIQCTKNRYKFWKSLI